MDKKIVPIGGGGGGGVNMADVFNSIYPIGSLYWSKQPTEPSTLFGGTWARIKDKFIFAAGDSHAAGEVGGEESHTLTIEETPAHTHTRGTMNITGTIGSSSAGGHFEDFSGAFYSTDAAKRKVANTSSSTYDNITDVAGFEASKSWTGETSSVGSGEAHNNMPPYVTYYCWERIG